MNNIFFFMFFSGVGGDFMRFFMMLNMFSGVGGVGVSVGGVQGGMMGNFFFFMMFLEGGFFF